MRTLLLSLALALDLLVGPVQANDYCENRVGMALVLAFDSSNSIEEDEWAMQMVGVGRAFQHPDIIRAILDNPCQKIAVTVVGWSDVDTQRVLVDWEILSTPAQIQGFGIGVSLLAKPFSGNTSIAGAMRFSVDLLEKPLPFVTYRRVVDISSDYVDDTDVNDGGDTVRERHHIIGKYVGVERRRAEDLDITINALPILTGHSSIDRVAYFDTYVITSDGFVVPAKSMYDFAEAIYSKLLMETVWVQ